MKNWLLAGVVILASAAYALWDEDEFAEDSDEEENDETEAEEKDEEDYEEAIE